jgi:ubiquinone/menaquinone biosynthesis C-methylase UbiE
MAHRVCPWWIGYLLASPLRRLRYSPADIVEPYVREGMTVFEPGPGMGFFTLELARMVGPAGRVVAVDIQRKMLDGLRRRVARAGVLERLDLRLARPDSMGLADLCGAVDFALVFAMVHEVPRQDAFFAETAQALKPGASLLLAEPSGHVGDGEFEEELALAAKAGFAVAGRPAFRGSHAALLKKG